MSHVTAIDSAEITNLTAIKNLCKTKGWKFRENQKTYAWYGRHVGDYPLPKGFSQEDLGKCDHAISIPGVNYEVGIVDRDDRYVFLYDFWDKKLKEALGGEDAPEIQQGYAVEADVLTAKALGFRVKSRAFDKKTQNVKLVLAKA